MNTKEVIENASQKAGKSYKTISNEINRSNNFLSNTLGRGSTPQADTLANVLDACGYKLAAIPADEVPASALVIDPTNKKE